MLNNTNKQQFMPRKLATCTRVFSLSVMAIALSACGGGGGDGDSTPPPSANNPPTVTADERVIVSAGDAVTLTASATDPEADTISYAWVQQNGDAVANTQGFDSASASFSALDSVDSLVFRVTATAGGQSDTTDVQVIIVEDTETAVFIDADFSGTSTGAIDAPMVNLTDAIANSDSDADFYIRTPSNEVAYSLGNSGELPQALDGGQSFYGGYNSNWTRDVITNQTPIYSDVSGFYYRDVDEITTLSGLSLSIGLRGNENEVGTPTPYGIYANGGSSEFIVENNTINVAGFSDVTDQSNTNIVYGVLIIDVDTSRTLNNVITTGPAKGALDRDIRTSDSGANGEDGEDASNSNGGDGGSTSDGGWRGGNGGDAGTSGAGDGEDGYSGDAGSGRTSPVVVTGGFSGDAGDATDGLRNGGNGGDGDVGVMGSSGSAGDGFGALSNDFYIKETAASGGGGWSGGGGGGGGGGASSSGGSNGGGGGGGGEAGSGGAGGFGGYSGGASIALEVVGGTLNEIIGNTLTSGNGGTGGKGGLGSEGGRGGDGGAGADGNFSAGGDGGNGGDGGDGGDGGIGGSGGGGPSFGIFIGGNTPATVEDNIIVTGTGGTGGAEVRAFVPETAGKGGWSYGIFDGDTGDNSTPILLNNTITPGPGGADGSPSTGTGQSGETNIE